MKAKQTLYALMCGCALLTLGSNASAAPDLGQLKGLMGGGSGGGSSGLSMGSLSSSNFGNVAGVLQYCMKNNYLGGSGADGVKDKVMAKLKRENTAKTAQPVAQSPEYLSGAKGLLSSSDGQQVNLEQPGIKQTVTKKVCDTVLSQAKSFL
jgi:hypothetical protein